MYRIVFNGRKGQTCGRRDNGQVILLMDDDTYEVAESINDVFLDEN